MIALTEYQRRRQELDQKIQALAAQTQQLDAHADHHAELAGLVTSIAAFCQRVRTGLTQTTFEQKRTLVELLIDRVVVANDEVEIRYVIPTSPAGEHTRFCHLRKDYFHPPAPVVQFPKIRGGIGGFINPRRDQDLPFAGTQPHPHEARREGQRQAERLEELPLSGTRGQGDHLTVGPFPLKHLSCDGERSRRATDDKMTAAMDPFG